MIRNSLMMSMLCMLACADDPTIALEPVGNTTVRFHIPALPEGPTCVQMQLDGYGDRTWYTSPSAYWHSYGAALDAGALCSVHDFEHVVSCQPGQHTAQLNGILYDGDTRNVDYFVVPVSQRFQCHADEETVVQLPRMQLMEASHYGFIDLGVNIASAARLDNTCMSVRIENAAGGVLMQRSDLCTDRFGSPGSLTYLTTCDAESSPARVRLVIDDITFANDVPLADRKVVNPCPPGDATHMYWSHACVMDVVCEDNRDSTLLFELELAPPTIDFHR